MRRMIPVLLAVGLLVSGCTPGGGTPSPSPSSPAAVSSSASVTPTPTPSGTLRSDALYAEAERVYRAAVEAQWKYELTGDYSEFPAELADYYSADQLREVQETFEFGRQNGVRVIGGVPSIAVRPLGPEFNEGSVVAVRSCYDGRGLTVINAKGESTQGQLIEELVYFRFEEDRLKIFDLGVAEVAECFS